MLILAAQKFQGAPSAIDCGHLHVYPAQWQQSITENLLNHVSLGIRRALGPAKPDGLFDLFNVVILQETG